MKIKFSGIGVLANDFVAYEYEEEIENTGNSDSFSEEQYLTICKTVECLTSIKNFVESRQNPVLSELFLAFYEKFAESIEDQLISRLG